MVTRHLGGRLAREPQRGTLAKADGGHHLGPDQEAEQPPPSQSAQSPPAGAMRRDQAAAAVMNGQQTWYAHRPP